MPNLKISELTIFTGNVQNDDLFEVVDVSDTTMAATGTNKKVTWQDMKGDLNGTYVRLNGANGPMTGDLDTLSLLPDDPTAQVGTDQASYAKGAFKNIVIPDETGGNLWLIDKNPDPDNDLRFALETGTGPQDLYKLNSGGTPTDPTDLATKAYVDSAGGVTVLDPPTPAQYDVTLFEGPSQIRNFEGFKVLPATPGFAPRLLFIGPFSLEFSDTNESVVIGFNTPEDLDGEFQVIIGAGAGKALTTGASNTLVGYTAGNKLTQGGVNTLIGTGAGSNLTTGAGNVMVGSAAGRAMVGNSNNVAMGRESFLSVNSGDRNVSIGNQSLYRNVAFQNVTSATNCVTVGFGARNLLSTPTNEIIIGQQALGNGDNTTTIGNNQTTKTFLKGEVSCENIRYDQLNTPPAGATAPGDEGQILIDADFIYVCVGVDTWKRAALTTF